MRFVFQSLHRNIGAAALATLAIAPAAAYAADHVPTGTVPTPWSFIVDAGNSWHTDLQVAIPAWESSGAMYDVVNNIASNTDPDYSYTPPRFTSGTKGEWNNPPIDMGQNFTVVWYGKFDLTAGSYAGVGYGPWESYTTLTADKFVYVNTSSSATDWSINLGGAKDDWNDNVTTVPITEYHVWEIARSGDTVNVYCDGTLYTSTSGHGTTSYTPTSTYKLRFGRPANTGTNPTYSELRAMYVWNRALTASERAEITDDPWAPVREDFADPNPFKCYWNVGAHYHEVGGQAALPTGSEADKFIINEGYTFHAFIVLNVDYGYENNIDGNAYGFTPYYFIQSSASKVADIAGVSTPYLTKINGGIHQRIVFDETKFQGMKDYLTSRLEPGSSNPLVPEGYDGPIILDSENRLTWEGMANWWNEGPDVYDVVYDGWFDDMYEFPMNEPDFIGPSYPTNPFAVTNAEAYANPKNPTVAERAALSKFKYFYYISGIVKRESYLFAVEQNAASTGDTTWNDTVIEGSYAGPKWRAPSQIDIEIKRQARYYYNLATYLYEDAIIDIFHKYRPDAKIGFYSRFNPGKLEDRFSVEPWTKNSRNDALYPEIYTAYQGSWDPVNPDEVALARRLSDEMPGDQPVVAVINLHYHFNTDDFLSTTELQTMLNAAHDNGADSVIIWESSSNVDTTTEQADYKAYTEDYFIPAMDRINFRARNPNCIADINEDGTVDSTDLLQLIGAGRGPHTGRADINGDGLTDGDDLAILFAAYGPCP